MDKKCDRCGKQGTWISSYGNNYCSSECCLADDNDGSLNESKVFSAMVCGGSIVIVGTFILIALIVKAVS